LAVFITGGYGHIGSWIAYLFAKQGKDVILYDIKKVKLDYLDEVKDRIKFVQGDVKDFTRLSASFQKYSKKIEGIIHTAGVMGEFVNLNPYYSVKLNVIGTLNILEIARIFNINKIIYTSTGAIYDQSEKVATEESKINPPDLYAATKLSSEHIGIQYGKTFGIDFRVGRLYFVYGPGKLPSDFTYIYKMVFGILEGIEGMKNINGGDQKFDFTYVEDAARGIVLLYEKENPKENIFNIATGKSHSIREVIDIAIKYSHYSGKIKIRGGKLIKRTETLNIQKIEKETGYKPLYSLEEGIKKYSHWISRNIV